MDGGLQEQIPTNLRPLMVLEAVASAGGSVTPTELNARLRLPKPTIHRLFATLEAAGFLQRNLDGRSYEPGPRLRRVAGDVLSSAPLRSAQLSILEALSAEIGETCNIAVPDRDAMIYLERVETKWPLRIQLPVGTRVPLYCTASGKLYLSELGRPELRQYLRRQELVARTRRTLISPRDISANLAAIRAQGYALDAEEFMDDMVALAVPVRADGGRLLATLSFHAPTRRFGVEETLSHLSTLQAAAGELEALVRG